MKSYLISKGENPQTKGLIWLTDEMFDQMKEHNNLEPVDVTLKKRRAKAEKKVPKKKSVK